MTKENNVVEWRYVLELQCCVGPARYKYGDSWIKYGAGRMPKPVKADLGRHWFGQYQNGQMTHFHPDLGDTWKLNVLYIF